MSDALASMEHHGADNLWRTGPGDEAAPHLKDGTLLCGRHGTRQPDGSVYPALVPALTREHMVCAYCVRDGFVPDPRLAPDPMQAQASEREQQLEDLVQARLEAEAEKENLRRERIDFAIARGDVAALKALDAGEKAIREALAGADAPVAENRGRRDADGAVLAREPGPPAGAAAEGRDGSAAPLEASRRPPVGEGGSPPLPATGNLDRDAGRTDERNAGPAPAAVPLRPAVAEPRAEAVESPLEYFIRSLG